MCILSDVFGTVGFGPVMREHAYARGVLDTYNEMRGGPAQPLHMRNWVNAGINTPINIPGLGAPNNDNPVLIPLSNFRVRPHAKVRVLAGGGLPAGLPAPLPPNAAIPGGLQVRIIPPDPANVFRMIDSTVALAERIRVPAGWVGWNQGEMREPLDTSKNGLVAIGAANQMVTIGQLAGLLLGHGIEDVRFLAIDAGPAHHQLVLQ
jgi:hypothetical protein